MIKAKSRESHKQVGPKETRSKKEKAQVNSFVYQRTTLLGKYSLISSM